MQGLNQLRNLGPKSARILVDSGIRSAEQIRSLGAVPTYLLAKHQHSEVSLNLLWAIEGFLLDCDWRDIPAPRKLELLRELENA